MAPTDRTFHRDTLAAAISHAPSVFGSSASAVPSPRRRGRLPLRQYLRRPRCLQRVEPSWGRFRWLRAGVHVLFVLIALALQRHIVPQFNNAPVLAGAGSAGAMLYGVCLKPAVYRTRSRPRSHQSRSFPSADLPLWSGPEPAGLLADTPWRLPPRCAPATSCAENR